MFAIITVWLFSGHDFYNMIFEGFRCNNFLLAHAIKKFLMFIKVQWNLVKVMTRNARVLISIWMWPKKLWSQCSYLSKYSLFFASSLCEWDREAWTNQFKPCHVKLHQCAINRFPSSFFVFFLQNIRIFSSSSFYVYIYYLCVTHFAICHAKRCCVSWNLNVGCKAIVINHARTNECTQFPYTYLFVVLNVCMWRYLCYFCLLITETKYFWNFWLEILKMKLMVYTVLFPILYFYCPPHRA